MSVNLDLGRSWFNNLRMAAGLGLPAPRRRDTLWLRYGICSILSTSALTLASLRRSPASSGLCPSLVLFTSETRHAPGLPGLAPSSAPVDLSTVCGTRTRMAVRDPIVTCVWTLPRLGRTCQISAAQRAGIRHRVCGSPAKRPTYARPLTYNAAFASQHAADALLAPRLIRKSALGCVVSDICMRSSTTA